MLWSVHVYNYIFIQLIFYIKYFKTSYPSYLNEFPRNKYFFSTKAILCDIPFSSAILRKHLNNNRKTSSIFQHKKYTNPIHFDLRYFSKKKTYRIIESTSIRFNWTDFRPRSTPLCEYSKKRPIWKIHIFPHVHFRISHSDGKKSPTGKK